MCHQITGFCVLLKTSVSHRLFWRIRRYTPTFCACRVLCGSHCILPRSKKPFLQKLEHSGLADERNKYVDSLSGCEHNKRVEECFVDELSAEAEKPCETHKGGQANIYFKNCPLVLARWFHSVCLLSCTVDGPYSVCEGPKVVKEDASYGCSKSNNRSIAADYPAGDFITIADEDHLKMVKQGAASNKK